MLALPTWGTAQPTAVPKPRFGLFPVGLLWSVVLEAPLAQPPGFFGSRALIAFDNGHLTAFDLQAGKPLWTVDRKPTVAPVLPLDRA